MDEATLLNHSFESYNESAQLRNVSLSEQCLDHFTPSEFAFEFYANGLALNLVGLVGIFGNILSMIILSRPQMRSSINYLLIGLARCDTILIITSILLFGIRSIYPYTGYMSYYFYFILPQIIPFVYPLSAAAQTASGYLTLMVSLERYVAVCHPLRARALCTYGRSKYYVLFCAVIAILFNVVKLWDAVVIQSVSPTLGPIYCVRASQLRMNKDYIKIYVHWCYFVVNYIIPFLGLSVFNVLIYMQVRRANQERQKLSRSEKREIGLATMLMFVVAVFFTLNLLAMVINIREAFWESTDDDWIAVSNLLVTLNSSVNFLIYVIFGEKFKRIFLLLFCTGREPSDGLMHDDSSFSNYGNGEGNNSRSGSKRFSRHGTHTSSLRQYNNTTPMMTTTGLKTTRSVRVRAPSPAPCVYYPTHEIQRTITGYDWEPKNGVTTTGF